MKVQGEKMKVQGEKMKVQGEKMKVQGKKGEREKRNLVHWILNEMYCKDLIPILNRLKATVSGIFNFHILECLMKTGPLSTQVHIMCIVYTCWMPI